jgi:hypothetical protein
MLASAARRRATLLGLLLPLSACDQAAVDSTAPLPAELAARRDAAYISGRIIDRTAPEGGPIRLLVRAPRDAAARVPEAIVTVLVTAKVFRGDGTRGSTDDLRAGRTVTVWVTGAELRSLPPQVTGNGFLLGR